ncbi:hypothetical protein BDY19DRAFT_909781 [Irpex rosettiformis]|uniref:Uncharacterized protein n=1 Tax=Irpex rosettiformis TaxID=378272 RepID=A0ACB8TRV7_9APHY|nr:hypothetical protein BDY19DRAFT_909781 [Irpex rosettiformis]
MSAFRVQRAILSLSQIQEAQIATLSEGRWLRRFLDVMDDVQRVDNVEDDPSLRAALLRAVRNLYAIRAQLPGRSYRVIMSGLNSAVFLFIRYTSFTPESVSAESAAALHALGIMEVRDAPEGDPRADLDSSDDDEDEEDDLDAGAPGADAVAATSTDDAALAAEEPQDDDDGAITARVAAEAPPEDVVMDDAPARSTRSRASLNSPPPAPKRQRPNSPAATTGKPKPSLPRLQVFKGDERVGNPLPFAQRFAYFLGPAKCPSCIRRQDRECITPYTADGRSQTCRPCRKDKHGCEFAYGNGPVLPSIANPSPAAPQARVEVVLPAHASRPSSPSKKSRTSSTKSSPSKSSSSLPIGPPGPATRSKPKPRPTRTQPSATSVPVSSSSSAAVAPPPPESSSSAAVSTSLTPAASTSAPSAPAPSFTLGSSFLAFRNPPGAPSPALSMRTLSSSSWTLPDADYANQLARRRTEAAARVDHAILDFNLAKLTYERAQGVLTTAQRELYFIDQAINATRSAPPSASPLDLDLRPLRPSPIDVDDEDEEEAADEPPPAKPAGKGKKRAN